MAEIYVLIGTGTANRTLILERYGQYGLTQVEALCELKIVHLVSKDTYQIAPNNPSLDPSMIHYLGELFTRRFCKPVAAQLTNSNFLSFYAEGLNQAGRKEWLAIDDAAFDKKLEIARNPKYKGDIPMFTFTSTDSIRTQEEDDNA